MGNKRENDTGREK